MRAPIARDDPRARIGDRPSAPPLAGFVRTLRDNGFSGRPCRDARCARDPGSAGRDRGLVAQAGVAVAVLRDAFRLGALRRDLRCLLARPRACASARCSGAPRRRIAAGCRRADAALAPQARRPARSRRAPRRRRRRARRRPRPARRRFARRKRWPTTDLRHIVDPDEIARTHALAARLARVMRARLVRREQVRRRGRRLDLRRTIHRNVSPRRHADRPRLAPAQDQAAAPRRPARRLGLDEPLHGVLRALPARRRRCFPRGGSLRVPHAARPRVRRRCATAT